MLDLKSKLLTGTVRRYHILPVAREQTLADHHYRVFCIAEEILRCYNHKDYTSNFALNVAMMALYHDRSEVKLGDIPTNAKIKIKARDAGLLHDLSDELDPEYAELVQCDKDNFAGLGHAIVKCADMLEALDYLGQWGVGLRAQEVWGTMWKAFDSYVTDHVPIVVAESLDFIRIRNICMREGISRGWLEPMKF